MHYEKAPCFKRAPPPLRCTGLRSATAALESNCSSVPGGKRTTGEPSQISWRMAFYLEGKTSVGTNDLSPKEATQMSHDVKYIGGSIAVFMGNWAVEKGAPWKS